MVIKLIYIDLYIILNFIYDLIILVSVAIALKRTINKKRIIIASLFGSVSTGLLFLNLNSFLLLILKLLSGLIMEKLAFGQKTLKSTLINLSYLYMCSIILAGFLYFLSLEFSLTKNIADEYIVNYILILLIAPIIFILYLKQQKLLKQKENLVRDVKIIFKDDKEITIKGFIDTGNKLKDPVTNKYVIIVDENVYQSNNPIYVPFRGVGKTGLLKCFSIKRIEINNQIFTNYLIGISDTKINLDGTNCILNCKLLEDLNV